MGPHGTVTAVDSVNVSWSESPAGVRAAFGATLDRYGAS